MTNRTDLDKCSAQIELVSQLITQPETFDLNEILTKLEFKKKLLMKYKPRDYIRIQKGLESGELSPIALISKEEKMELVATKEAEELMKKKAEEKLKKEAELAEKKRVAEEELKQKQEAEARAKAAEDIAKELIISVHTVYSYRNRILEKMKLKSNVELTQYAIQNNLIKL